MSNNTKRVITNSGRLIGLNISPSFRSAANFSVKPLNFALTSSALKLNSLYKTQIASYCNVPNISANNYAFCEDDLIIARKNIGDNPIKEYW